MSNFYSVSIITRIRAIFLEKDCQIWSSVAQLEERKPMQGENMRTITVPDHILRLEMILLS